MTAKPYTLADLREMAERSPHMMDRRMAATLMDLSERLELAIDQIGLNKSACVEPVVRCRCGNLTKPTPSGLCFPCWKKKDDIHVVANYKGVQEAPLSPVCIHCCRPVPAGSIVCSPCADAGDVSPAPLEYGYGCVRCGAPVREPQAWCEVCR